jgi:hypothetical protein
MRLSWVQGIFMFYILILICEMMVTGNVTLGNTGTETIFSSNETALLASPNWLGSANFIPKLVEYIQVFMSVLLLWSPTIFSGYYLWVWWIVCFPVCVSMIVGVIMLIRGV